MYCPQEQVIILWVELFSLACLFLQEKALVKNKLFILLDGVHKHLADKWSFIDGFAEGINEILKKNLQGLLCCSRLW